MLTWGVLLGLAISQAGAAIEAVRRRLHQADPSVIAAGDVLHRRVGGFAGVEDMKKVGTRAGGGWR